MSLVLSSKLLRLTKHRDLKDYREYAARQFPGEREFDLELDELSDAVLEDLVRAAQAAKDSATGRALEAIHAAREGQFDKPIPNFGAFSGVLEAYLRTNLIDGWIYVRGPDRKLYPQLVVAVAYDPGDRARGKPEPSVIVKTLGYGCGQSGRNDRLSVQQSGHRFSPHKVTRKRVAEILSDAGIYHETKELKESHVSSMRRHIEVVAPGFAQQFRVSGRVLQYTEDDWAHHAEELVRRRIIHDTQSSDYDAVRRFAESTLFKRKDGTGEIPEHPVVRVFDLKAHEFFWVHSDNMEPYVYDKGLRNKLVLPQSHRDLLDVLTEDLSAFVSDIVEGKSAGNVILCKGIPGVGKTLTAEVYAELIGRPLYSIHSGQLGTSAEEVEKRLQQIFSRAKRWHCVLLLDEADVFVVRRGNNIDQNAIVAEFLRALEYFDELLFMTTNRPDDIDEAIISRCAAIIGYQSPGREDAAAVWRVMASQYRTELGEHLIEQLLDLFPGIAPRDIKMLLRLALRVCKNSSGGPSVEVFRRCAMFRAIDIATPSPVGAGGDVGRARRGVA